MKKRFLLIALCLLALCTLVLFASCGKNTPSNSTGKETDDKPVEEQKENTLDTPEKTTSEGLEFTSNGDGTCYLSGIGTCTDIDIVIPSKSPDGDAITSIGYRAFYNYAALKSIEIPDSVTKIAYPPFTGCDALRYNIYDNAKYLGNPNNPYLVLVEPTENSITSCNIHPSTKLIVGGAFAGCSALTSITISSSVTSIEFATFAGCSSLTTIIVAEGNPIFHSAGNCIIETKTGRLIIGCKASVIPDDGSVTSIGEWAFYGYNSLTSIEIPYGISSIEYGAFENCSSLMSIDIPDSITSIEKWAFDGCNSLQYNTYDNAFYLGNSSNPYVALMSATDQTIDSCAIHPSTKLIACDAFDGCKSLTSIAIPNGITSIGDGAFVGCHSLTNITIPSSVTSIGDYAFEGCTSLENIKIPNGVASIGDGTFVGCHFLTSITIPNSATSISEWAFSECASLTNITYTGTMAEWNAITKGRTWDQNTGNYVIHCADGDIVK